MKFQKFLTQSVVYPKQRAHLQNNALPLTIISFRFLQLKDLLKKEFKFLRSKFQED